MMKQCSIAIGCLVQWYEVEIVGEYLQSVKNALKDIENKENVIVDLYFNMTTSLEKIDESKMNMMKIVRRFSDMEKDLKRDKINLNVQTLGGNMLHEMDSIYTIADYRREFNAKYCDVVDILVWGESDSLLPKQMFVILNDLHQHSLQNNTPKYLAFFGGCKMWDDSWKPVEHNDFTNKQHSDNKDDWWSVNYTMTIDEMNEINEKVDELDVRIVSPHKFNGCGLVISSEVIRSGVNIPRSAFFVHEDTAFSIMTNKVLGDIPQYVIKNILLVHNRKSMNKREYIQEESGNTIGEMRKSNNWYTLANQMCDQNNRNLFNPNYKSFTWDDVFNKLEK